MNSYSKFYDELNKHQKAAVDTVDGPLLVLAGPGTGKTQLLSVRAAHILQTKPVKPDNILILTYTNSAAKAMKERLAKVIGQRGYEIEVGTFHSFANSIIQESEEAANYAGDKIQMDDVERMRCVEHILDNVKGLDAIRPFRAPYTYLKEILQKISELKKEGIDAGAFKRYIGNKKSRYRNMEAKYAERLEAFSIVYDMYEKLKEGKNKEVFDERGRYDFDDMIIFATEALKKEAALKKEYQDIYRYVMVDEYQDTNGAQLDLLFTLLDYKNPNLLCVGDDDQSIYRFQGANVGNFKILSERFLGLKVVSLKENYRSDKDLIEASTRVIGTIPAKERMEVKILEARKDYGVKELIFKEFSTVEEELIYIVDKIKELKLGIESDKTSTAEDKEFPYNNIAVLVRKRSDILRVIDAFLRAGIPYATDGKEDISGEVRVKQLMDVLDLMHLDPKDYDLKDLALYKVLTADYLEIPLEDVLRFVSFVNNLRLDRKKDPTSILAEFLGYFHSGRSEVKFTERPKMERAAQIISDLLTDSRSKPIHAALMDFVKSSNMFGFLLKQYSKNKLLRIRQLRSLVAFINMIKATDIAKPGIRLDDLMLELRTKREHGLPVQGNLATLTQAGVRIYTAHGSKGLEFKSVIIPFCLDNKNWPARPIPDKIKFPSDLFSTRKDVDKEAQKLLAYQDETRLFYVAMTRAKSNLIFTASPSDASMSSQYISSLGISKEVPEHDNEEELLEKSLVVTDAQDPFIGTDEVLRDMIKNLSLNPTRLNTYIFCKRKFLYNDVLKLPGAKKKSLVFGNCVHKALEDTYRIYMETRKFPPFQFFLEAFKKELRFQGVDKVMSADCINKAKTLKGWFDSVSCNPVIPVGLEKKLLITVGDNIIFTGKYDKVEWEDEAKGVVRIVDYKTGKPDKHLKEIDVSCDLASEECDGYLRQLVCYKLLFEKDRNESCGRRVGRGALVFIEPVFADLRKQGYKKGDHVTKTIDITEDMVLRLESLIKEVWDSISALSFDKLKERSDDKCGMCEFDPICWGPHETK